MYEANAWTKRLSRALVPLFLFGATARADIPPNAAEFAKAGEAQFEAVAAKARAKGDLPRLSVPSEAAALDALWDMRRLLGTPPYRKGDIGVLVDISEKRNAILARYVHFKPNGVDEPDLDRNLSVFQDEIARATQVQFRLAGASVPALQDTIGTRKLSDFNPKMVAAARQIKSGFAEMVRGALKLAVNPRLRPENQALIVEALAGEAAALASVTSLKERADLVGMARAAMPKLRPRSRTVLKTVVADLSPPDCESLCRLD